MKPLNYKPQLRRFALHSTATCVTQASSYGKCVLATYGDVKKDICKEEFAKFRHCVMKAVRPFFPLSNADKVNPLR